jgi:hypothetical protein
MALRRACERVCPKKAFENPEMIEEIWLIVDKPSIPDWLSSHSYVVAVNTRS